MMMMMMSAALFESCQESPTVPLSLPTVWSAGFVMKRESFAPFRRFVSGSGAGQMLRVAHRFSGKVHRRDLKEVNSNANSAFHPFGVDKRVVSCNQKSAASVTGGAIW